MPPLPSSLELLQATCITKSFAGIEALRGVSFDLNAGEVHALIGENGAGKSTLIKVITGALTPDSGRLTIRGTAVAHNSPVVARSLGVAAIYQQPSLFPHLTVAENIAIAIEGGGFWRRIDWRGRAARAADLLDRAGLRIDPRRLAGTLSMPEQQIVEIAKALRANATILVMDEPTTSLTEREVSRLFEVIRNLRNEGAGIIYISHRLEEIAAIADRVTILRDGRSVGTRPMKEAGHAELIRMMVGRDLSAVLRKRTETTAALVLELRVGDVILSVGSGEIVGLAGLVGSGRTELAETLFGLRNAERTSIRFRGKPVRIESPRDAIRMGIGYLPEDRRRHGLILEMAIASNVSLAILDSISHRGMIAEEKERNLARDYVERLRIKTASIYSEAGSLSGGNQQKVALARWLAMRPSLLILDEPTQGVDVGSKAEIHELILELAARGVAILMISSELAEILAISDRIAVMHRGAIGGVLSRHEATEHKVLALALGHASPGRELLN